MRRRHDLLTSDMFAEETKQPMAAGALDIRSRISAVMSDVIAECKSQNIDRYQISAEMSRLLNKEVSVHMLNAYTSVSREAHFPPLDVAIAFDIATGGISLLKVYSDICGCNISVGKEILLTELGRIETEKAELAKAEKAIKKQLESAK